VPKRLLVLICFLLVAAGGESPVRLDMSSEETYRETLHAMKAQLPDEQQVRLYLALAIVRALVLQEMDRRTLLHGKTAQQIFDLTQTKLAEADRNTSREMLAEKWAKTRRHANRRHDRRDARFDRGHR
jgi:hypothetical protein